MAGVYVGESLKLYSFGNDHPFGVERHDAFWNEAKSRGLHREVNVFTPIPCVDTDLKAFHTDEYIEFLRQASESGIGFLDFGDTPAFKGIFEAVSYIVGSDLDALARMFNGEISRIFIPIGGLHHARRDTAGGFCAVNDIGIVIRNLRENYGVKRIAYVDIDAHHGDGVQYSFNSDPDLIFADIHEDGRFIYPGTGFANETGIGAGKGSKMNLPVLPESGDDIFFNCWGRLEEFVRASKPEIILFQAGADSVAGDPITHLKFSPAAHAHATRRLCALADEFCDGRLIAWGGGGYNLRNIGSAWCEVVQAMIES